MFLHFSGKWDKNSLVFANVYAVINLGDIHLIVFLCNFIKFRWGRGVLTHFSILDKPWGNSFSLLEHCISLKVNTTFWNKRITLHNLLLFYTLLKDPLCMIYKLHWFIVMIVKKKINDHLNIKFDCYPDQNLFKDWAPIKGLFWPMTDKLVLR